MNDLTYTCTPLLSCLIDGSALSVSASQCVWSERIVYGSFMLRIQVRILRDHVLLWEVHGSST